MKIPHNRDEMKEDAKELAQIVERNFMDDVWENIWILGAGILIGIPIGLLLS